MECIVYVLQSTKNGAYYVGHTNNLERRLAQHNDPSKKSWASRRGPWSVIAYEKYGTRVEAMKRERYIKSLKTKRRLLELIKK